MAIKDYRLNSMLGPRGVAPRQYDYSFGQPTPQRKPTFDFDQTSPDVGDLGDVQQAPQKDNASRFYDELQKIRSQPTPGETAYKSALGEMPTPDQYKPNWLTRIASGLSGFSAGMKDAGEGIKVAYGLNRAPYESAMEQYKGHLGGLQEQYRMESGDKDEQVKDLMSAASMGMKYDDYMLKKQIAEQKFKTDEATSGAAVTSARARMLAAENAGREEYNYVPVQGGFMVTSKHNPNMKPQIIPAKTIQDAQLQVSRGHLGVAQAQLGLNTQSTEAGLENTASLIADREKGDYVQPSAQSAAAEAVDNDMMLDKRYAPFFKKRGFTGAVMGGDPMSARDPVGPTDFPESVWNAYIAERNRRIQEKLRMTR